MKTIILILTAVLLWMNGFAQEKNPIFLGFEPGITKEPFYPDHEFDVNVLPIVFLTPLSKRIDIRATSLVNLHIGGNEQISDVGVFTVFPVYFSKKEAKTERSKGLYCGPVLGLGYNFLNKHGTITTAIEPGYGFEAKKNFTLSIGLQVGVSYFKYDDGSDKWQNHWGPKFNLGWWF